MPRVKTRAAARKSKGGSKPVRATRSRRPRPPSEAWSLAWWLSPDGEFCRFCLQRYAHGTGYRCVGCDVAVCNFCVEYRDQEAWCPEC